MRKKTNRRERCFMLKMKIVLDEDKILTDNQYSVEAVKNMIDMRILEDGIEKICDGEYVASESQLIKFLAISTTLSHSVIMRKYVKSWLWYESDEEIINNDPEDLLETYKFI